MLGLFQNPWKVFFAENESHQASSPTTIAHQHCYENAIYIFLLWALPVIMQSQFPHSCICERFIKSLDLSIYFLKENRQVDHGNILIASQTHECGNWHCGHAIPFWENNYSFFGNICWEFSVLVLCSEQRDK